MYICIYAKQNRINSKSFCFAWHCYVDTINYVQYNPWTAIIVLSLITAVAIIVAVILLKRQPLSNFIRSYISYLSVLRM